jgi:lactoylglutathione lyase
MDTNSPSSLQRANVTQVVPFLHVSDAPRSVEFYVDRLGFEVRLKWEPEGRLRWCWLTLGGASIMVQEIRGPVAADQRSQIDLFFICDDALAMYELAHSQGLNPSEPKVGNGMWVTSLIDPDGNKLSFESPTDVKEDTKLSDLASTAPPA